MNFYNPTRSHKSIKVFYSDAVEIPASADPLNVNRVSLVRQDDPESEIAGIQMSLFSIRFYFMDSEALAAASLSKDKAFDLSRDHLRENVLLRGSSRQPLCIALTSYLKDGIINIYIDKECCPSFDFTNNTQMKFSITTCISGDENDTKNRQMNPSLDWDSWFDLDPRENFCYQCKAFRDSFPKIGSNVAGHMKIITRNSDGEIAPVNEFTLKEINGKLEFTIENQNIAISYQKSANCYYVLFTDDTKETSSVIRPLNIPITNAGIGRINVTVIDDESCEEVFDITIDNLIMKHKITTRKMDIRESRFSIDLGSLQIDNQSTDDYDHFPVVLLPLREVSQRYRGESPHDAPFSDTHANLASALLRTVFIVHTNGHRSFIDDLTVHAEPLEIYSEDSFIYRLVGLINSFTPPLDSGPVSRKDIRLNDLRIVGQQILNPLNTGNIGVEDLRILLSIHASVKMYLAADHMPIVLGKFNCPPTRTLSKEIVRRIMYHYATQALVRAGLMLGSLEILASPTGLFRSLGKGISDFFALPYDGLTRGPSAFVSGISSGMGSFVRHTSVGALTSITNFASSLSRNMDRLSLDEEHMIRQEQHRCRTSLQVWPGFSNAVSGFGISLLGAVAGLVDHPISNIQKAENTGDAFKGAAKGLGKGLMGMMAKPIGGAMELLSQTGQGILLGTGLTMPPKKLKIALEKPEIIKLNRESDLKYSWKVLRVEFEEYDSLFVTTDVHISSGSNRHDYDGAIILTSGAFYLFDSVSNNISLAFACNEIELRLDKDNPHVLYIEKRDKSSSMSYNGNELASPDSIQRENSNDSSRDSSRSTPTNFTFPFLLQMSPRHASLLYSQFEYQKDIFEERMADDLEVLDIAVY